MRKNGTYTHKLWPIYKWVNRQRMKRERDDIESRVAQGKRGGLITRRTVDRNHSLLTTINSFYAIREEQNSEQWGKNACTHTHTHTHTHTQEKKKKLETNIESK